MAQNRFKNTDDISSQEPKVKSSKKKPAFDFAFGGGLNMGAYYIFKNINFIFFLAFIGIIYIANSHYAVKTIKKIKDVQHKLEQTSWKSNAKKSDLMFESMQSRIMEKVTELQLEPISGKPKKIEVEKK